MNKLLEGKNSISLIKLLALLSFCGGPLIIATNLKNFMGAFGSFALAFMPVGLMVLGLLAIRSGEYDFVDRWSVRLGSWCAVTTIVMHGFGIWHMLMAAPQSDQWLYVVGIATGVFSVFLYGLASRAYWVKSGNPITPTGTWHWIYAIFLVIVILPISNQITRIGGVVLILILITRLVAKIWKHKFTKLSLFGLTSAMISILVMPIDCGDGKGQLEEEYVKALKRYEGTSYVWGGESPLGIDCSGLVRRALVDAMFCIGVRDLSPSFIKCALLLWFDDSSAMGFLNPEYENVRPLREVAAINQLDHSHMLFPGDLAITKNRKHVMAYMGDCKWIEADPGIGKVAITMAPNPPHAWFSTPVILARWMLLDWP